MSVRFAQISDTHLSPVQAYFHDNFCRVVDQLNRERFELVINSGDLSLDGADRLEDLKFSKASHDAIDGECLFLPGNHDIGEEPYKDGLEQPISVARRNAYISTFHSDYWRKDVPHWTLIGLNAQLMGSNLPQEMEQWTWLERQIQSAEMNIGIFVHKPVFVSANKDTSPGVTMMPDAALQFHERLKGYPLKFISCGHLHQFAAFEIDNVTHCWAPSTGFLLSKKFGDGREELGYLEFVLSRTGHRIDFVPMPSLDPIRSAELRGPRESLRQLPPFPTSRS